MKESLLRYSWKLFRYVAYIYLTEGIFRQSGPTVAIAFLIAAPALEIACEKTWGKSE